MPRRVGPRGHSRERSIQRRLNTVLARCWCRLEMAGGERYRVSFETFKSVRVRFLFQGNIFANTTTVATVRVPDLNFNSPSLLGVGSNFFDDPR